MIWKLTSIQIEFSVTPLSLRMTPYLRMMSAGSADDSDFLSGIFGMRPCANLNRTLSVVFSLITRSTAEPISSPEWINYAAHNGTF